MQCTRMRNGRSEIQCMGLHRGEGGGGGGGGGGGLFWEGGGGGGGHDKGVRWGGRGGGRGLHCSGMMRESAGCMTSESVGMHEVEVLCESVARWVGIRQSCCAELC